jgi:hypothetical protein
VATLVSLAFTLPLEGFVVQDEPTRSNKAAYLVGSWLLPKRLKSTLEAVLGTSFDEYWATRLRLILSHLRWFAEMQRQEQSPRQSLRDLMFDSAVTDFLDVHSHEGVVWYNKERFDELAAWLYLAALYTTVLGETEGAERTRLRNALDEVFTRWKELEEASGYRVDALIEEQPGTGTAAENKSKAGGSGGGKKGKSSR